MNSTRIEHRRASDGTATVSGYASLTETPYDVAGLYTETIARGAFTGTLAGNPDVVLRVEHQPSPTLARTKAGTLRLTEDSVGLSYVADLDLANRTASDVYGQVKRGDLAEASFAFHAESTWNDARTERRIEQVSLDRGDVSLCAFGCSPTTTATTRSALSTTERRALTAAVGDSCGPWVLRAANQFGAHQACSACDGSGDCAACDGTGQVWADNSDDEQQNAAPPKHKAANRPARSGSRKVDDDIRRRAGLPIPLSLEQQRRSLELRLAKLRFTPNESSAK